MKKTYIQPCTTEINVLATTILAGSTQDFSIEATPHAANDFGAKESFFDFDEE